MQVHYARNIYLMFEKTRIVVTQNSCNMSAIEYVTGFVD